MATAALQYSRSALLSSQHWRHGPPHRKDAQPASPKDNNGDYSARPHELISSTHSLYEVLEPLGCGTFGQVVKCWKKDTNEIVALKILKSIPSYAKQGQVEIDVLTRLSKISAEEFNFVRAYESFTHRGHICIVFELLQVNLYDYLKKNKFQPLHLKHIRPIAQQVVSCLGKLQDLGLVHADIKPENIMLVDPDRQPFRVKLIDFGSATNCSQNMTTTYLQSRYYRAPEVILGLPFNEAIDMWSLGCVLAELFLGWPLFPGASEFHQMSYICQMLGHPPAFLLRNLSKTKRFFTQDPHSQQWKLKPPLQVQLETGVDMKETRKFIFTSVDSIASAGGSHGNREIVDHLDTVQFVLLLGSLLTFDPQHRATPSVVLQHPFITMQHLATHTTNTNVRDWIQCMQVCCQSKTTHSYSPLSSSNPQPYTPPFFFPAHSTFYASQPGSTLNYFPLPAAPADFQTVTSSQVAGTVPTNWSHPSTALATYPSTTRWALNGTNGSTGVAVDTGYVSGDPSPAAFTQLDYSVPGPLSSSALFMHQYHRHFPIVPMATAPAAANTQFVYMAQDFHWMTSSMLNREHPYYKH